MKYEITIHQFEDFTEEELRKMNERRMNDYTMSKTGAFYDSHKKTTRIIYAELSEEEVQSVKKAIVGAVL